MNIKLHRYPMSEKSVLYKLKTAFFGNVKPEELLSLMQKFDMKIGALRTLAANAELQYLCTILYA